MFKPRFDPLEEGENGPTPRTLGGRPRDGDPVAQVHSALEGTNSRIRCATWSPNSEGSRT